MLRPILLLTFLISFRLLPAQEFDLSKCLDYAMANSVSVQNAKLDERIAESKVRETAGLGLPQINGSVGLNHNIKLQRFFTVYSTNSFFFGGQAIPGLQEGDVVSAQNFFQLKSSGNAGISVSQLLFNGSYIVGLQASNAYKELSVLNTERQQAELVDQVTRSYYLVIINRERMKLFDRNLERLDTLLRNTTALNEKGFVEAIDVDRLRVAKNNLITEREKFSNLVRLSVELLKFQINYPMDQELKVIGDLLGMDVSVNLDSYASGFSYQDRPDVRVLEGNRRLQQLSLRNSYAASLPSLVAVGSTGRSTQSPNIGGLFRTNTQVADNGRFGPDAWYPYTFVGVTMNVPIFSGLQRTYRIQQDKITLNKVENALRQVKSGVDLEVRQSILTYQNTSRSLEAQRMNVSLAENISRVARVKYEQGVGSSLEVMDAETALREAQVNYQSSLYEVLLAKLSLDKAYGKLIPKKS